jgi:hypothetical protein
MNKTEDGMYSIMLNVCTTSVLRHLLDPVVPYVWIHNHIPDTTIHWWKADVPVNSEAYLSGADVRLVQYDLLMSTDEFLAKLDFFLGSGISLSQMNQKVPNSLWIESIPAHSVNKVLMQNGMKNRFYLPHAMEVANFRSVDINYIKRVSLIPEIAELLINGAD